MTRQFLRDEGNQSKNESGYIVVLSIGSILGAGLFCGSSVIYDRIGVYLVPLIILTGVLAVIVNLFLIEMNLVGPSDWNYTQVMEDVYGPAAGHFAVSAYIGAMVIGPASEIVAAGMMLCAMVDGLPLFPVCLVLCVLVFGINHIPAKQEVFNYNIAVFKILALLGFCCIGLFAVCHLFQGIFYTAEVPWPIRIDRLPRGSVSAALGAVYGAVMIHGGIESVGFLRYSKTKERDARIAVEAFKIMFRSVFINVFSVPIIILIMTMGEEADASIFIRALKLIGCHKVVIDGFRIIIFFSAVFLAITSMLPTTQMLKMRFQNTMNGPRQRPLLPGDGNRWIERLIYGLILVSVLQTAWLGEKAYAYMFFFSGLCFCVMWSMIAMSCSKFCNKYGNGSEWRVPGEKQLRILVLVILAVCFAVSLMTELGRVVVLIGVLWFAVAFLWYRSSVRS